MREEQESLTGMLKRIFFGSDFIMNTSKLAGGTGIAQAIPFFVLPFLSRLYTPEEFGWFGVYYAMAMVISVLATGRYELAILLPDDSRKANHITRLAEWITLVTGGITLAVVLPFHRQIATLFSIEPVAWTLMLLPVSIIGLALLQVYAYRHNREKNYTIISSGKIIYSIVLAASQIGLGVLGFTVNGLIIGSVIAIAAHSLALRVLKRSIFRESGPFDPALIKDLVRTYIDFPRHNAPHALTSSFSIQLPVVLLNRFLGEAIAGLYHMAFRIVQAPVILITGSIGQVYSQKVSEMHRAGQDIHRFTRKLYKTLALAGIIPFTALTIWGPEIFAFVLGAEWEEAGHYAQIFSPAFLLMFIVSPTIYLTALLNQQKKAFQFEFIFIVLRLGALSTGIYLNDPIIAIAGYSIATMLMMLMYMRWFLKLTRTASARQVLP